MNILDSILEKWNKDKDIEALISADFFSDPRAIEFALDRLNEDQKPGVIDQLNDIESALLSYIENVDQQKKDIQRQLDSTLKSAQACLSYGSSIDIQNKGKE